MVATALPHGTSPFTLSTSGVAGLVGGDEAVLAMAATHVYDSENRQGLGWYNSPGSYQIAKRLSHLARSRIPDNFSPGVHTDPTKLVKLDIAKGPKFRAAHSGTVIEDTGHVGYLVMKECAHLQKGESVGEGRKTGVVGVTVVKLNHVPAARMYPKSTNPQNILFFARILIILNLSSCVACIISWDWWAFSLVLLGILANGISSVAIGSGKLQFTHPAPANGSPPGDGILVSGKQIALLMGAEGAVNSITRGSFSLNFSDEAWLRNIEWCSILFTIQFISQLLLIPQASQFGQIMFAASLGASSIYNSWLASLDKDKDKIQRDILFKSVLDGQHELKKYTLGTFTCAVVFALLVLQPEEPIKFLDELLPDTNVWAQWKKTVVQKLCKRETVEPQFAVTDGEMDGLTEGDKVLLEKLYTDAETAYRVYTRDFRSTSN